MTGKKIIFHFSFSKKARILATVYVKFTSDLQKIMGKVFMKNIPKHTKDKKVNSNSQLLPMHIILGYLTAFFDERI